MKRFIEADESAGGFVKNFAYSMCGAVVFMMFGPAAIVLYHYTQGTLTNDLLKLPIESM